MAQLNYHHLYYFYVTVREGTIAKAAEFLHVTPQTVSGQITTFETYLGTELFDRRNKRLYPNTLGKMTFEYAEQIFTSGQELLDSIMLQRDKRIRTFTVGVTDVVPKVLAFDMLKDVTEQFDSTRFIYREGEFNTLLADLAVNRLDLILADRTLAPESNIKGYSHFLGETHVSFFASIGLAEKCPEPFPACLASLPFLIPSDKSSLKRRLLDWFSQTQLNPVIKAEFDDSALMKLHGQEGLGAFCVSATVKEQICKQYQVQCIGTSEQLTERYYAISAERELKNDIVLGIVNTAKGLFV